MTDKSSDKHSFSLLTATGILFALLLCLLTSAMVVVAFPVSLPYIELLIKPEMASGRISSLAAQAEQTSTPFQPEPSPETDISMQQTTESSETAEPTPLPTKPSEPAESAISETKDSTAEIPSTASISGIFGSPQLYTLDCESQAAVDFARFFGVSIDEMDFISRLPYSDDPEEGFVGNINGAMGQFPPSDYGVHAKPVAKLLREYGVEAKAVRDWDLDKIRNEIASGRPVIVWIVNMPFEIDVQNYTASNGNTSRVARFEHTWIVTGYNMNVFTVIDSEWTYNVRIAEFENRWDALGNQAIIFRGE